MPSENDTLHAIGVSGEWIWGDSTGTVVFAQAFGQDRTIVFRFSLNKGNQHAISSRIVNCYHGNQVYDAASTISHRAEMRSLLWSAVASVWLPCNQHPDIAEPDVIINILDRSEWVLIHDDLFTDYLAAISPLNQLSFPHPTESIDLKDLVRKHQLGGRGTTTLVWHKSTPTSKLVFKGIDFRTFLSSYESGRISQEVETFKHSTELICGMPPHPNIIPPPDKVVTISKPGSGKTFICGSLYPFYEHGSLADQIDEYNSDSNRIPILLKAMWCYQMTSAVAHTHFVARTFHMDIQPSNFLLDSESNLLLIDWEQSDALVTTVAPELDGTWDAEEIEVYHGNKTLSRTIKYSRYYGPERRNMPQGCQGKYGWNIWNSLLEWQKTCPRASELAEVFSLGRSMWMLLQQYEWEEFEDAEHTEDVIEDWEGSEDIPLEWRDVIESCLQRNPADRADLQGVLDFWKRMQIDYERISYSTAGIAESSDSEL